MNNRLKLLCILAHPDDESLGMGGTLAKYAAEGIETYLLTATRGERGRFGTSKESPGLEVVGRVREAELRAAAKELGVHEVTFLDYIDGNLDRAIPGEILAKISRHIRKIKPQVVVTFGPEGGYGHPDHIAISQFATAAIVGAASTNGSGAAGAASPQESCAVSKLYYMAWSGKKWAAYQAALRDLKTTVDGVERRASPWPEWAITTFVDTSAYWPTVWRAVSCHRTQMEIYSQLEHLPEEHHRSIWGTQEYYRVFSTVNGGRVRENDLFDGLR